MEGNDNYIKILLCLLMLVYAAFSETAIFLTLVVSLFITGLFSSLTFDDSLLTKPFLIYDEDKEEDMMWEVRIEACILLFTSSYLYEPINKLINTF